MKQKKSINQMLETNINTSRIINSSNKAINKVKPQKVQINYDEGEIIEIDDNINNDELKEINSEKPRTRTKTTNLNVKSRTQSKSVPTKKLSNKVNAKEKDKINDKEKDKINDKEKDKVNDEEKDKIEEKNEENEKNTNVFIPIKIKDNTLDPNHSKASINFDTIDLCPEIKKELEYNKKLRLSRMVIPWTEKYRPNKLEDLLIDDITKEKLRKIIDSKQMPNILITGGPGEGKTSTILLIAKQILGLNFKEALLELNASDERGIKTHNHVINFCKKKLHFNEENSDAYARHKIILLDEADNMTKKGQQSISINGGS